MSKKCGSCGDVDIEASGPVDVNTGSFQTTGQCSPCGTIPIPQCTRIFDHGYGCGCNSCSGCRCGCARALPNSTPYYAQASMCPEDNKQKVIINRILGAMKTAVPSCMPACNQSVRIVFQDVAEVPYGAWLWSFGLGSLEIRGFNPITHEVELMNLCPTNCPGQAPAGTPIPSCTLFAIQAPSCGSGGSGGSGNIFPYLNAGFTAPADGNCLDITVTNVNGLAVNKTVSINNGLYRISAVKSATIITICNDGDGLVPGTVVNYADGAGNLIVPIVLLDANPCTSTGSTSGKIMVCKNNVMQPLTGTENNQIPVLNNGTGEVNFRTLGIPVLDCTELTACLTLDPALPDGTPYLVLVQDTSNFTPAEIVVIGGTQFTVTSIVSLTQMYITPIVPPTAVQTYGVGATLCSADCCTILDQRLQIVESRVLDNVVLDCPNDPNNQWLDSSSNYNDATPVEGPINVVAGNPAVYGNEANLTFQNLSCNFTMGVHVVVNTLIAVDVNGADGDGANVRIGLNLSDGVAPVGSPSPIYVPNETVIFQTVTGNPPGINRKYWQQTFSDFFTLAPGEIGEIKATASFAYENGDPTSMDIQQLATRITYIAVAIK